VPWVRVTWQYAATGRFEHSIATNSFIDSSRRSRTVVHTRSLGFRTKPMRSRFGCRARGKGSGPVSAVGESLRPYGRPRWIRRAARSIEEPAAFSGPGHAMAGCESRRGGFRIGKAASPPDRPRSTG
jgi:hypothetical protein